MRSSGRINRAIFSRGQMRFPKHICGHKIYPRSLVYEGNHDEVVALNVSIAAHSVFVCLTVFLTRVQIVASVIDGSYRDLWLAVSGARYCTGWIHP